jgi:hypothetical protein
MSGTSDSRRVAAAAAAAAAAAVAAGALLPAAAAASAISAASSANGDGTALNGPDSDTTTRELRGACVCVRVCMCVCMCVWLVRDARRVWAHGGANKSARNACTGAV